jgi:hypothetical protein
MTSSNVQGIEVLLASSNTLLSLYEGCRSQHIHDDSHARMNIHKGWEGKIFIST